MLAANSNHLYSWLSQPAYTVSHATHHHDRIATQSYTGRTTGLIPQIKTDGVISTCLNGKKKYNPLSYVLTQRDEHA